MTTPDRRWNACVEVAVLAWAAPEPPDIQIGEDDDYCMASTRRDGVWNDRGVADPPLCCWRPTEHHGRHHDPYHHLDWEIDDNDAMPGAREAVAERDLLVMMLARTYSLLPPDRVALVDDGVDEMVALAAQPAAPEAEPERKPCPDGDNCPDARRWGAVHPKPAPERER